jgi:hypothetical protein
MLDHAVEQVPHQYSNDCTKAAQAAVSLIKLQLFKASAVVQPKARRVFELAPDGRL